MKRSLVFILLFLSVLTITAQQNLTIESFKGKQAFNPDYSSQSKFLFDYDVHFYGIDISVSPDNTFISGNATIGASTLVNQLDTFAVELIPQMVIDSAFLGKDKLSTFTRNGNNVLFPVPALQPKGKWFSVKIYYHGTSPSGGFFSGVTTAYNKEWKKHVTWTLSEPFAAMDWFPVKQDLKDKADSAWIFLTTDSSYMAGSEGLLTRVVRLKNGKKRYEWKTHYPIDYYLLSFSVADYRDFSFYAHPDNPKGDSVLVQNFIYNDDGYLQQNRENIKETAPLIELYVKLFGPYPFRKEKYGHCLSEIGGGMEHQTMTTLGNFGFDLVAHELGHMWFGDNVTCADWSDIWVNEGFATYADYLANEYLKGSMSAMNFIYKAQLDAMSKPGGSIYIPPDEIYLGNEWRIFSGRLSYDKGASILHMLRHEINNDSIFFSILKTYQQEFADSVATGKDFNDVVNRVTGKDYNWFFRQWYYGEGYPVYNINWYQKSDTLHILSTQTTSAFNPSFFKMTLDYQIVRTDKPDTLIRLEQTANTNRFAIPVRGTVKNIVVDPYHWSLQKVNSVNYVAVREQKNQAGFSIGPNPAQHWLFIQFIHPLRNLSRVMISDVNGRVVYNKQVEGSALKIDVSGFRHGLYIIRVSDGRRIFVRKFLH